MVGFVKVVKCSFGKDTWYFDQIGNIFFIQSCSSEDWLVVYSPFFLLDLNDEPHILNEAPIILHIHKSDVVQWQG